MTTFSNNVRNLAIAADPESGDGFRFVLAHFGEDATLVRSEFRKDNPRGDHSIIVFTHDVKPRRTFCSAASVGAAIPMIEVACKAMPDGPSRKEEAGFWVSLCEAVSCSYGSKLLKMAGLD